jgi:hypothetical protein
MAFFAGKSPAHIRAECAAVTGFDTLESRHSRAFNQGLAWRRYKVWRDG